MAMLHSWIVSCKCGLSYPPLWTVSVTIRIWPVIAVQLQCRASGALGSFLLGWIWSWRWVLQYAPLWTIFMSFNFNTIQSTWVCFAWLDMIMEVGASICTSFEPFLLPSNLAWCQHPTSTQECRPSRRTPDYRWWTQMTFRTDLEKILGLCLI